MIDSQRAKFKKRFEYRNTLPVPTLPPPPDEGDVSFCRHPFSIGGRPRDFPPAACRGELNILIKRHDKAINAPVRALHCTVKNCYPPFSLLSLRRCYIGRRKLRDLCTDRKTQSFTLSQHGRRQAKDGQREIEKECPFPFIGSFFEI